MKQRNVKHEKRLKKLTITCLLLAVVLIVGTYAWFIGMQVVSVDAFEVKIASVDGLALSLDGSSWGTELTITKDELDKNAYAKKTYSWTSLKPVSSIGAVSDTTSKLIMYDKGSLTATDGGYRLMSALVNNKAATTDSHGEEDGYVAFDLFIKNLSGDKYYENITTPSNEEGIYLSTDSKVTVGEGGSLTTGIENSVRVAFAQIGRVKSDATASLIQSISCATAEGITPICSNRLATIYEPNDTKHVDNAITWFTKTCMNRGTGGAYTTTKCTAIKNNQAYDTYVVSGEIDHTAGIDVYDGLNGYTDTIATSVENVGANKLFNVDTFTDTERDKTGVERPEFFYLAPNSVTKIRVYVYLEGQDVDNYDFASLGTSIKAQFGFTKERFTNTEIGVELPPEEEPGSDPGSEVDPDAE